MFVTIIEYIDAVEQFDRRVSEKLEEGYTLVQLEIIGEGRHTQLIAFFEKQPELEGIFVDEDEDEEETEE